MSATLLIMRQLWKIGDSYTYNLGERLMKCFKERIFLKYCQKDFNYFKYYKNNI